ncbi:MAG TPA: S8 family serine peptidase [Pyrinomonadaceae bacterium]|nr:S8 family serine peptidase [Pyrinomonadaceae bacterium]
MSKQQYILLPKSGFLGGAERGEAEAMRMIPHRRSTQRPAMAKLEMAGRHDIKVVDSISEVGPKLIEMDRAAGESLVGKDVSKHLRLMRAKHYRLPVVHPRHFNPEDAALKPPAVGKPAAAVGKPAPAGVEQLTFTITDAVSGKPVAGAKIAAYVDFANQKGAPPAVTDNSGKATVPWLKTFPTIESLYIFSPDPPVYWGVYRSNLRVKSNLSFAMKPVVPTKDAVTFFFPKTQFNANAGVLVGIVDTGVAKHPALNLVGGANLVQGEDPNDFGSSGNPHGTHVAGLVGANGLMRGIAPKVMLRSYRVFGKGAENATNFAILKGIDAAVKDGCDIINLSLGVDEEDKPMEEAITHARDHGAVVIAAAANNYGGPVGFPSAYPICLGVSAIGRMGTFPKASQPAGDISSVVGENPLDFFAAFSSIGPTLNFTGPGVGLISTVPDDTYGQMSGCSMACPVVSGCAASLLSQDSKLLKSKRDRQRSDKLVAKLAKSASSLGFAPDHVGKGMPAC